MTGFDTDCVPVWEETSVQCAVHRDPGFYCFLLFPIVSRCTSAVHRNLTFHTGLCDDNDNDNGRWSVQHLQQHRRASE